MASRPVSVPAQVTLVSNPALSGPTPGWVITVPVRVQVADPTPPALPPVLAAPPVRDAPRASRSTPRPAHHPGTVGVRPAAAPRAVVALRLPAAGRAAAVVAFVLAQVGRPYVFGAAGPRAFDCSGLVMAAYAAVGISLPHFTGGILGRGVPVSQSQLQPGDVIFPSSGHVAVYIGRGLMVHAPHTGTDVQVSPVYAFWSARRLL